MLPIQEKKRRFGSGIAIFFCIFAEKFEEDEL